jgi:RNA polymerase primary sigma factor
MIKSKESDGWKHSMQSEQSFEVYLHDIHDLPLLSSEDEQELIRRIQKGRDATRRLEGEPELVDGERAALRSVVEDAEQARDTLVAAHLRLVVRVARQYTSRGISLLDLIQEGNIALLQAAANFDPAYGVRFATYALWWVRHAIARSVAEAGHPIRLPEDVRLKVYRLYRARNDLLQQYAREPGDHELARATGFSIQEVQELSRYLQPVLSLHTPVGDEGDSELLDVVPDPAAELQVSDPVRLVLAEELEQVLRRLAPEEQAVLRLRFGLYGRRLHSRRETAHALDMTTEQVQRLEARALRRLRDPELLHRLEEFMDR